MFLKEEIRFKSDDFALDSFCLRVVCKRSKLIGLPHSNFTLKGVIVFNRMRLSSGKLMFVLDLFHRWNGSEVEFMEVDRKDPWERHSFLILLAPLINECCPLGLTLKRRLHTWFQFAPNSIVWECNFFSIYKTISRV